MKPHAPGKTPWWIAATIAALAALQPLVHLGIALAPPPGAAPSGLHIPDSALFLQAMDMFATGFASPYATCQAGAGDASLTYFSVPHLWLYGVLGLAARALGADPFLLLGFANGIGAALWLIAAWRFLRAVAGPAAPSAWLFFALGAGPGGVLYLAAALLGLHDHPAFDAHFLRFALYDLAEGAHPLPVLYFPRLYYTLSLACCFGGFTALIHTARTDRLTPPPGWFLPVLLGSFLNARFTVFTFGLVLLFLVHQRALRGGWRAYLAACYALPMALGWGAAAALLRTNPAVVQNHLDVGNMALWIAPLLPVLALPALIAWPALRAAFRELPGASHFFAAMAWGYLLAYALAYLLYQAYHGNLLRGHDAAVAAACSDPALLGALAGLVVALVRPRIRTRPSPHDWVLLWLLLYLAAAISGWGGGAFLNFGPQRLAVFLWMPLCLFAALGLEAWPAPGRRAAAACLVAFGVIGALVATFAFQGPLGRHRAQGPYPAWHAEIISEPDTWMLDRLGEGMLLAPAPAADVAVRLRGNPVVFGVGSFNLTDVPYTTLRDATAGFFHPETPDADRRAIAQEWCVEWVWCPDTWPVDPATRAALDASSWLHRVLAAGRGTLYRVAVFSPASG
jgi:hypothetical protein